MPGTNQTAKLQSGQFWELSCSTKLEDVVSDVGAVQDNDKKINTNTTIGEDINFSLNIMCCDPKDDACENCDTTNDTVPIIKIGPKSKADSSKVVTS